MDSVPRSHYNRLYNDARKNSANRNILFNLSKDEFDFLVRRAEGRCMLSGIAFSLETIPGATRRPWAPSIDRIDSAKGYTAMNVRLVCCAVNLAMNEWGADVLLKMARNLVCHEAEIREQMAKPGRRWEGVPFYTIREYGTECSHLIAGAELGKATRRVNAFCDNEGVQILVVWTVSPVLRKDGEVQYVREYAYPRHVLENLLDWRQAA